MGEMRGYSRYIVRVAHEKGSGQGGVCAMERLVCFRLGVGEDNKSIPRLLAFRTRLNSCAFGYGWVFYVEGSSDALWNPSMLKRGPLELRATCASTRKPFLAGRAIFERVKVDDQGKQPVNTSPPSPRTPSEPGSRRPGHLTGRLSPERHFCRRSTRASCCSTRCTHSCRRGPCFTPTCCRGWRSSTRLARTW